jgi:hypothetical protein
MSEQRVLAAEGFRRFGQTARMQVRHYVRKQREAPPLTLWASEGENPRRVRSVPVGAAHSAEEVRQNVVAGIRERESAFAAIGRLAHVELETVEDGRSMIPTSRFVLVVASADSVASFEVPVVAGKIGAWQDSRVGDGSESEAHAWFWIQQAIRGARRDATG